MDTGRLLEAAIAARENAYCPYSRFAVGAALLCEDGSVAVGCNVENASFGATICAERSALVAAVSQGKKRFLALAIVGGALGEAAQKITPCGMCLQVLAELCEATMPVVTLDGSTPTAQTLGELFPSPFRL